MSDLAAQKPIVENRKAGFNPILWGTIGYLFLMIFRPWEYWEWLAVFRIQRVYMILLIIAVTFWPDKRYFHHQTTSILLMFFGVMMLSALVAFNPGVAWEQVWEQIKLLVLYFVLLLSVRDEREFRILVLAFLGVMSIYIGKSMWEFFIHGRHVYRMGISRLIGIDKTFNDPNTFAATIIYSFPIAWAFWKSKPSKLLKYFLIGYAVMCISAIGLTGSRTGMLSFVFFIFLIWFKGRNKLIGFIAGIALIIISWFFLPEDYKDRFRTIFDDSINESATESAENRIIHVEWGFQLFFQRPILGWGPGNAPYVVNEIIGQGKNTQLHNLTAQLLSEIGILGALALAIWLAALFKNHKRIRMIQSYIKDNNIFLYNVSLAVINTVFLLLFQGLSGHNLYRYTWFIITAFIVTTDQLIQLKYIQKQKNLKPIQ